jgi:hypothetical protein
MSSKAFTRQIFDWLHQVNTDDDLTPADVCVALQLTRHFNEDDDGGRAWPSCKFIGDEIGLSESTVINSVRRLHKHGHLRVVWGQRGRGHPNQYWMEIKPQRAKVLDDVKHQPVKVLTPQSARIKPQPAKENHLKNQGEGGGPGRPSLAAAPQLLLLEIYNRGHLKDAAALPAVRTAFHAALKLASADDIIAGARVWVAAFDNPRFLPPLQDWLAARGWEKPPPKKHRNGHGGKRNAREQMWEREGFQQDENGNWYDPAEIGGGQ